MGFVHFNEKGWLVDAKGKPFYVTGINYVASYICTNFFDDWRPEILEKDLAHIKEMGLNAVRIPIFWGFTEPEEGVFNQIAFERFGIFLDWMKKYDLYVMPWFLVGVATVHKDVPYRQGRPYFEGDMLFAAENHLRQFARCFKDNERILFWDICDEPEFYERHRGTEQIPYDPPRFKHWMTHMYEAFKKEDPNHLVTMGYGHIATAHYGYNIKDCGDVLDALSVTCYPGEREGIDTMRNNYLVGFYAKMNASAGKPVITLEAPGFNNIAYSEDMVGRYFNVSIYSNLICGSTGVMPWVYNDFQKDIWEGNALNHQPCEPYFGIITNEGRLKPSGKALKSFGDFIRKACITDYTQKKAEAAIFLPVGYYYDINNNSRKLQAAMYYLKGCGMSMDYVWEGGDYSVYKMIVLPAVTGDNISNSMLSSTWHNLMDYVKTGGVLVHSWDSARGFSPYNRELFGAETITRQRDFDNNEITFLRDFGSWKKGEIIPLCHEGRDEYLRVKPENCEVIAVYSDGYPAITKNNLGKGTAWFFTGKFYCGAFDVKYEDMLSSPVFAIHDALIAEAGLKRAVHYIAPELETGLFNKNENDKLLIFVNHGFNDLKTEVSLDKSLAEKSLKDFNSEKPIVVKNGIFELALKAADALVIQIS